MEQEIFEMIQNEWTNNIYPFANQHKLAKEITQHVFEFIEWLFYGSHNIIASGEIGAREFYDYETLKIYSIEELYQYWLKNQVSP